MLDDEEQYYGYDGKPQSPPQWWMQKVHARRRSKRLEVARQKGQHTPNQWTALTDIFDACVRCAEPFYDRPTKDHIVPIFMGGCDCIANLQPLCRSCNSGKGGTQDLRPLRNPRWCLDYIEVMEALRK